MDYKHTGRGCVAGTESGVCNTKVKILYKKYWYLSLFFQSVIFCLPFI